MTSPNTTSLGRATELAVLAMVADILVTAIEVMTARYPELQPEHDCNRCSDWPAPCCFANNIIETLYALDEAINLYFNSVEEQQPQP